MRKVKKGVSWELSGRTISLAYALRHSVLLRALVLVVLAGVLAIPILPAQKCQADTPASLWLTGWGWCLAYKDVGNVTANLTGTMVPRAEAPEISDLFLAGTVRFNLGERTDSFDLELRGTKVRSLFFLRQATGGDNPVIAEFEGTWLDETDYVACEGRVAVPVANHVARPYVFVLRTPDRTLPSRETGNFVANVEFAIQKGAVAFDAMADRLAEFGENIKDLVGTVLTEIAVLFREVRKLGIPYFP